MLLLDVQVEIDPQKESLLNEWYYLHVPRLVSVPGYESGRRYIAITPRPRYLALYEIGSRADLPSLLGSDRSLRHPLTLSEWTRWDKELLPHMSHCRTNVYEPIGAAAAPIFGGDWPLVCIHLEAGSGSDVDLVTQLQDEIDRFVSTEADVVSAKLLRASRDPAIVWLDTKPSHLLIIECAGSCVAGDLANGEAAKVRGLLGKISGFSVSAPQIFAYRQIARHWPWFKEN